MWHSETSGSRNCNHQAFSGGRLLLCVILILPALASCASADFLKGAVPNETGFEGAVTVDSIAADGNIGIVTVTIPYLDVHGNSKLGQGRLFVRKKELESGQPLPAFVHVHYEKGVDGARSWCEKGWAVATAHYKGNGDAKYPIDIAVGDGYNLAHALLQWVRRLPFIDRQRLHIDGGSQGGYMALAMSADMFPVTSTTADVPVVNWAYNFNYIEANKPAMQWKEVPIEQSPLPGVYMVTPLADMGFAVYGNDLSAETWYRLSPIACLDQICNPVLMVCATGDMLVPMEQMTRTHLRPYDRAKFPANFVRDFDTVTICEPARKVFEELVPPEKVHIELIPLQENGYEITREMLLGKEKRPKGPKGIDRPWSRDHQWSICYLDEGPPTPYASHASHEWATGPDSFVAAHQTRQPSVDILNAAKLEHLMRRHERQLLNPPILVDGQPANRLNFDGVEKRDVVRGLLDYAGMGPEYTARLQELYEGCAVKPFGDTLNLEELAHTLP